MLTEKIIRNFLAPVFHINSQFVTERIPEDRTIEEVLMTLTASEGDNQPPNNKVCYRYRISDMNEDSAYSEFI